MDSLIGGRYQIINNLGKGGFGETFLATDTHLPSQKLIVIKRLQQLNYQHKVSVNLITDLFKKEAKILEDLGQHCPHIPTLYAYFVENDRFYLVQEYIEGKSLLDVGVITSQECLRILTSLLKTLHYIHSKKIIHRDIKPENIIIRNSDREPVLIDFGAVKETMGTIALNSHSLVSSVIIGTQGFMPPEQTTGRTVYSSDLFALGLTMIYSLTGKYPIELKNNYLNGELEWHNDISNIEPSLQKVLEKATRIDLSQRYATAEEMYQDLYCSGINIAATISSRKNLLFSQINESQINNIQTSATTNVAYQAQPQIDPQQIVKDNNAHKINHFPPISQLGTKDSYIQKNNSHWFFILFTAIAFTAGLSIAFLIMKYVQNTQAELAIIEQQKTETETKLEEKSKRLQVEKLKREAELARIQLEKQKQKEAELARIRVKQQRQRQKESEKIKVEQQKQRDKQIELPENKNSRTPTTDNKNNQNNPVDKATANKQIKPQEAIISSSFFSQDSIAAVQGLYNSVSQKQYRQARSFFVDPNQLDPKFFNQFTKVTVTNLKVTQENQQSVTLVGTNTYYYPDGSSQIEKRNYTLIQVDNNPKIKNSNFIKVVKSRS